MAQLKTGTTIGGRDIVQEFDSHKNDKVAHIDYAVASGTNTYTANIQGITALVEGLSVKIKFQNANTGASTLNINGLGAKEIRKSNGNALSAGNIKAGQICHLVYTGSVFQLLGEGGEYGTAQPEHVLQGYTIGTEQGIVAGTMPNQGRKIITPSTTNIAIPQGYHDGTGYVVGDSDLKASNIRKGVNIFGITGTLEPNKNKQITHSASNFVTLEKENLGSVTYNSSYIYLRAYDRIGSEYSIIHIRTNLLDLSEISFIIFDYEVTKAEYDGFWSIGYSEDGTASGFRFLEGINAKKSRQSFLWDVRDRDAAYIHLKADTEDNDRDDDVIFYVYGIYLVGSSFNSL